MLFKYKLHKQAESINMEKYIHANTNYKKVRVAVLISGKEDFKTRRITRDD